MVIRRGVNRRSTVHTSNRQFAFIHYTIIQI